MLNMENAVILNVRFGRAGDSLQLNKAEMELVTVDADKKAIKGRKRLFECKEYEAISSFDKRCQKQLALRCLPAERLLRAGFWLVNKAKINDYVEMLQGWRAQRAKLVTAFLDAYAMAKADARIALRSLYRESDYPSYDSMRERFTLNWAWLEIVAPQSDNGVGRELERNAALLESLGQETIEQCRVVLREGLYQLVAKAADRLKVNPDGSKVVFRDSLLTNMTEFLSYFDERNAITEDGKLAEVVEKAKAIFQEIPEAGVLRSNLDLRAKVRQEMVAIQDTLEREGFVEMQGRRSIQLD